MSTTFQQTVGQFQAAFYVGNIVKYGPVRSNALILNSTDPDNNIIGNAFTFIASVDGQCEAGGTGVFAGILVGPNQYASVGDLGQPLNPTLTLNNGVPGDIMYMGIISVILGTNTSNVTGASNIGDQVVFDQTTGVVSSIAPAAAAPAGTTVIPNASVTGYNIPATGYAEITLLGGQIQS